MLQLSAAGKRYGHKLLFDGLDWMVTPRDHLGLVGANGTGKSTLMKVLAGIESLDDGDLTVAKGTRIGYLPQDGLTLSGRSVFQECLSVFARLKELELEMERLTHLMADLDPTSAEYRQVAERYQDMEAEFAAGNGYAVEAEVGMVLDGLGFAKSDWHRNTEEFSGGWQMRVALAKLLLEQPNLLLLDEPTNHLDLEARNWLEGYLRDYPYAFVLISHDRYFLDVAVSKVVEVWNKKVHFYAGNFSAYDRQKTERRAQLEAAARNQRERVEQLEAFINRFRYQATKARQVQSRIKELEKIERIELPPEETTIHFSFPQPRASGRVVAEFRGVSKSYGDKGVLENVSFTIERGDKIALVGVNGAGKSTLIKLLAGTEPLTRGDYSLGHNVEMDYFAQDQYKQLDPASRILDDLTSAAPRHTVTDLRSLLGCFLFSDDDVFKRIGVLSGGERNRYALAKILVSPANFLLLDEPTNHLDMRAKDVLLEALQEYTGTLVFVSHDRYFLDRLATRVFEVADGQVHVFPGNYEDYVWRKEGGSVDLSLATVPAASANGHGKANASANGAPRNDNAARRQNPRRVKQLEDRAATLERQVAELEGEIANAESSLASFRSAAETIRLTTLLNQHRADLETAMSEWEQVSGEIEAAKV